jgi:hypothetical protein
MQQSLLEKLTNTQQGVWVTLHHAQCIVADLLPFVYA